MGRSRVGCVGSAGAVTRGGTRMDSGERATPTCVCEATATATGTRGCVGELSRIGDARGAAVACAGGLLSSAAGARVGERRREGLSAREACAAVAVCVAAREGMLVAAVVAGAGCARWAWRAEAWGGAGRLSCGCKRDAGSPKERVLLFRWLAHASMMDRSNVPNIGPVELCA